MSKILGQTESLVRQVLMVVHQLKESLDTVQQEQLLRVSSTNLLRARNTSCGWSLEMDWLIPLNSD